MNKKLILYFSKNGTTKETVELIKNKTNNQVDIINVGNGLKSDIKNYDIIFIGTGIYMGGIPGKIKKIIKSNKDVLKDKKVIFFIHGIISKEEYKNIIRKAIKDYLDINKIDIYYLGGKLDITKQNFFIKKLLKEVAKQNNFDPYNANTIDSAEINRLLEWF